MVQPKHPSRRKANLTAVYVIAGSTERFQRVHNRLLELGVQPPATHMQHVPCCIPGCSLPHARRLTHGMQSLVLTHAAIWWRTWHTPGSRVAIFEDDVDSHAKDAADERNHRLDLTHHVDNMVQLYGWCEKYRCTHAYGIDSYAGKMLWLQFNTSAPMASAPSGSGCEKIDTITSSYCLEGAPEFHRSRTNRTHNRQLRNLQRCYSWPGWPYGGLFGNGKFGQNRSMANYLHKQKGGSAEYRNTTVLHEPEKYTPRKMAVIAQQARIAALLSAFQARSAGLFSCLSSCATATSRRATSAPGAIVTTTTGRHVYPVNPKLEHRCRQNCSMVFPPLKKKQRAFIEKYNKAKQSAKKPSLREG